MFVYKDDDGIGRVRVHWASPSVMIFNHVDIIGGVFGVAIRQLWVAQTGVIELRWSRSTRTGGARRGGRAAPPGRKRPAPPVGRSYRVRTKKESSDTAPRPGTPVPLEQRTTYDSDRKTVECNL